MNNESVFKRPNLRVIIYFDYMILQVNDEVNQGCVFAVFLSFCGTVLCCL